MPWFRLANGLQGKAGSDVTYRIAAYYFLVTFFHE
jgi:hypothetical protein